MKSKKMLLLSGFLILVMILSSCADDQDELPPVAVVRARELLADTLGVDIAQVEIVSYEQAEWMDSCLGLGGPTESCLQVIVPGWQVELSVKGESYIARTDELGEIIRFENLEVSGGPVQIFPADPSDDNGNGETDGAEGGLQPVEPAGESGSEAAEKALQALAAKLGISADQIDVVSYTSAEWPNGCLGLAGQDEMCTEALVSGYRVELSVEGQTYIARTDDSGNIVRFEQSLN